jgi:hypothetical protein
METVEIPRSVCEYIEKQTEEEIKEKVYEWLCDNFYDDTCYHDTIISEKPPIELRTSFNNFDELRESFEKLF